MGCNWKFYGISGWYVVIQCCIAICFIVFTDMYAKVMFKDHLMNNPPEIELAETMDNTTHFNELQVC